MYYQFGGTLPEGTGREGGTVSFGTRKEREVGHEVPPEGLSGEVRDSHLVDCTSRYRCGHHVILRV